MKLYLSNILESEIEDSYENLNVWNTYNIKTFSNTKMLYDYQQEAIKRLIQILHLSFNENNLSFNENLFFDKYNEQGIDVKKEFSDYSFNRTSFWMATGSGKSIVLIKTIELLYWSMRRGLIPENKIMILLPREDLIAQFNKEIEEYNLGKNYDERINLVSLKDYEMNERVPSLMPGYEVYYYRSDLLRDERKQTILDYKDYLNNGEWYVFLDEAHRGQDNINEQSKMKQNINELIKNGFLFNFSATFTEKIDFVTCCYNFNLEKFITNGYGKNIYISQSLIDFKQNKKDFLLDEKQKQILKSIIMFSLIKNFRIENTYHNPLMVTYVNSVNIEEADLKIFFDEIIKIARGELSEDVFASAKKELIEELNPINKINYIFEQETFHLNKEQFDFLVNMKIVNVLELFYNSLSFGNIEWQRGESGKEILLKLASSDEYFGLIRIGDADSFIKSKLSDNFIEIENYYKEISFEKLNDENNTINLLMGSRSFYEGWDSNRPNIINLINIGGREAKKFVPQALGRGIRIQPDSKKTFYRKRLPEGNVNKNHLLESLFVFATDRNSLVSILDEIDRSSNKAGAIKEHSIGHVFDVNKSKFKLYIPVYKEKKENVYSKFSISTSSKNRLRNFLNDLSKTNLLINYNLSFNDYNIIKEYINSDRFFQIDEKYDFKQTSELLRRLILHIKNKEKEVEGFKEVTHEISHFKHIRVKVDNFLNESDIKEIEKQILKNKDFVDYEDFSKNEEFKALSDDKRKIVYDALYGTNPLQFKNMINIENFKNHYYYSMLYADNEKYDFIKHIVKTNSEIDFLKNLSSLLNEYSQEELHDWMFSRIEDSIDKDLGMPYFSRELNAFRNFYPDFIFWIVNENKYEIYFIDPKGTKSTSWESKVDYFKKLFMTKENKPIVFNHGGYEITFNLRLLTDDLNKVDGLEYQDFWFHNNDFDFLKK